MPYSSRCEQCYPPENYVDWRKQPMNEEIRKRLVKNQGVRVYYPSFLAAAQAWGPHIAEGLHDNQVSNHPE